MQFLILALIGMVMTGIYMFTHKRKARPFSGGRMLGNCFGDLGFEQGNSSTETSQSATQNNLYTDEQKAYLKNLLSSATGTSSSLMDALNQQLTAGVSGTPTTAEKAQTLQEKQGISDSYKNLATQSSEALAGRGTLDSGMANKVMANIGTAQAKANQTADVNSATRQQENLLNAIKSALGLTSVASSLSTQAQGQTGTSTGNSSTDATKMNASADLSSGLAALFAMCWVAAEVFGGWEHPKTVDARYYISLRSPLWFRNFYRKHGKRIAEFIHDKPILRMALRPLFECFAFMGKTMRQSTSEVARGY